MKPTRSERKLIALCALALAIPLGVAAFIGHINATPTIAATAPRKAPAPNAYDLYIAASNAIREAKPSVDPNLDTKPPTAPKLRAARYSLARKDAWLRQNKAGFALFKRAQRAESLAAPFYSMSGSRALRQMARYKVIESNAHWQRGDHNLALQSGLDIMQLGHDVQRGGDAYDFISGTASQSLARGAMADTLEHLNASQARQAARRIEQLTETRWTLEQALAQDKARVAQNWLNYFAQPDWRADFVRNHQAVSATWGTLPPLTWKERVLIQTTSKRRITADLNLAYQNVIAAARLPYGMRGATKIALGNPFIDATQNYLLHYHFGAARELTGNRVLMLRLALRAHQLEHGAPPPNLQKLAPNYIVAVPADPFGKGEALRYQTDGQTYTLWSIGPDGKDDGGTPVPWRKGRKNVKSHADERERLPFINDDSLGDYVAGRNH